MNGIIMTEEQKVEVTRQADGFIEEAKSHIDMWEARKVDAIKMNSEFTPRLVIMIDETIEHLKTEIGKSENLKEIVRLSA